MFCFFSIQNLSGRKKKSATRANFIKVEKLYTFQVFEEKKCRKKLDSRYCVNYLLKVPAMQLILAGDFERVQGKLHNIRPFFYFFFSCLPAYFNESLPIFLGINGFSILLSLLVEIVILKPKHD